MSDPFTAEGDLLSTIDLARRVVDVVNGHAEVASVDCSNRHVYLHLVDPGKADDVAALYALTDTTDVPYPNKPKCFTKYEGAIDGVEFTVFGADRNIRTVA